PAFDQIIHRAGRSRTRTRGRLHVPMVLRAPSGGGSHAPEHPAESNDALFAHTPGVRVVMPSSPKRAYGLLLASIRDPDPVIFLEPTRLYRMNKQEVEDNGEALPLDTCFVLREGTDVTLVSWGAMIHETAKAAGLGAEIAAEVADQALFSLEAPIVRVTGDDTPMPLFKLEHDYMPSVARVLKGIRRVLED